MDFKIHPLYFNIHPLYFNNHQLYFNIYPFYFNIHPLGKVKCPVLIVTGTFDYLTPSYQSYQMAHHMPNAFLLDYTLGTHFVLLEYSDDVAENMYKFFQGQGKYKASAAK